MSNLARFLLCVQYGNIQYDEFVAYCLLIHHFIVTERGNHIVMSTNLFDKVQNKGKYRIDPMQKVVCGPMKDICESDVYCVHSSGSCSDLQRSATNPMSANFLITNKKTHMHFA